MRTRFNFGSAILAGILATVIMTLVMWFFGMNSMRVLGQAAGMYGISVYLVGGLIHFGVGIIYALLYAWVFEPLFKGLPKYLAGGIYSLLPFVISILFASSAINLIKETFQVSSTQKQMPYQYQSKMQSQGEQDCESPYESRYSSRPSQRESQPKKRTMQQDPASSVHNYLPMWLMSFINHLIYGIFLGIFYHSKEESTL